MGIINYMPGKGGMNIDGIIEDYYVYAGSNISAGNFVEFINGVAEGNKVTTSPVALSARNRPTSQLIDDKRVLLMGITTYGGPAQASILTVEGTTITVGTAVTFNDNCNCENYAICFDENKVFIAFNTRNDNRMYGIIGTINGNSIVFGSPILIEGDGKTLYYNCCRMGVIDSTHILLSYQGARYLILTINGNSFTQGTIFIQQDSSDNGTFQTEWILPAIIVPSGTSTFLAEGSHANNDRNDCFIVSCTGNNISFSSNCNIYNVEDGDSMACKFYSEYKYLVAITTTDTNGKYLCIVEGYNNNTLKRGTLVAYDIGYGYTLTYLDSTYISNICLIGTYVNSYPKVMMIEKSGTTLSTKNEFDLGNGANPAIHGFTDNTFVAFSGGGNTAQYLKHDGSTFSNELESITYEKQVRLATSPPFDGVAKTSGVGGTTTAHNQQVKVVRPYIE